jgi:hypothetical protein
MRCIWVLVIGCLVAAAALRPLHVERRDLHAAQIDAPPTSVAVVHKGLLRPKVRVSLEDSRHAATGRASVVARRQAAHLPELRLAPFVVAVAATLEPPKMITGADERLPEAPGSLCAVETPCARGPPIA